MTARAAYGAKKAPGTWEKQVDARSPHGVKDSLSLD